MKYKLILLLLIAVISVTTIPVKLTAQKASYNEAITVDPLNFLLNSIVNAKYEKKLSPTNSYTIGALLIYRTTSGQSSGTWMGYGLSGSYRWYYDLFKTRQKAIQGFSFGPRASLSYYGFSGDHNVSDDNATVITIGGEAMYKWVWDSFVLETGILLDFPLYGHKDLPWTYGTFGLNAAIGYAW
ncbi:MAG: hypothetical protein V1779_11655 [bacterium]